MSRRANSEILEDIEQAQLNIAHFERLRSEAYRKIREQEQAIAVWDKSLAVSYANAEHARHRLADRGLVASYRDGHWVAEPDEDGQVEV